MKHINLLPRLKQRELADERVLYSVVVAAVLASLILLLAAVLQAGVFVYLNGQVKAVDAEIEQLKRQANKTENAAVKQQIRLANAQIADFSALSAKTPQWASVLTALIKDIPTGVKITQFTANTEKQEVTINGFSPSRDLVIDLYNNINTDKKNFKNINYPLENITKPVNVNFNFTFNVADGVLVKEEK